MKVSEGQARRLDELVSGVLQVWGQQHQDPPHLLYHYTSAEGIIGILRTQSLWLTDLRYMNDMSELQYARDLVAERLHCKSQTDLDALHAEFLRRISSSFDPFQGSGSVFAASFCEIGNLLSQWRGYRGRGGGYSIGIDFFHSLRYLSRRCALRRVLYKEDVQASIIDDLIDRFLETLTAESAEGEKNLENAYLPALCQRFSQVLGEILFCLKHPDFHEEREWRLVHFARVDPRYERDCEIPQFRSFQGNVIPFYSVDFSEVISASKDDTLGMPFPIQEINIGPTLSADLNRDSVRLLVLGMNPDVEPKIERSEIPLRWL